MAAPAGTRPSASFCLSILVPISLLFYLVVFAPAVSNSDGAPLNAGTSTPTATTVATPTWCPTMTPEPLWVDPVTSPTDQLAQVITVYIGNGEAVSVGAESGIFTSTGSFGAWSNPALVTMTLFADTTHHLWVTARVRTIDQGGCTFGGYTLSTGSDRYGTPLVIVQQPATTPMPVSIFLPFLLAP